MVMFSLTLNYSSLNFFSDIIFTFFLVICILAGATAILLGGGFVDRTRGDGVGDGVGGVETVGLTLDHFDRCEVRFPVVLVVFLDLPICLRLAFSFFLLFLSSGF